jgi:dihydrodipicolinate synthase/N-acetylneuraminate lyase
MSEFDKIEAVLAVKPGETLVIKAGRDVRPGDLEKMAEAVRARLPKGVEVLVLGGDLDEVAATTTTEATRIAEAVRLAAENPGKAFEVGE